jgi:hypothetical protein
MLPHIDLPRALLRGRYMAAAAAMEWNGTPVDVAGLAELREHWNVIQDDLIAAIDANYGVYEGRSFRAHLWERWLITAFRDMAHPHFIFAVRTNGIQTEVH